MNGSSAFFERALNEQDEVFQFWVAENGQGSVVGWEMLSAFTGDPASRRLTGETTTALGRRSRPSKREPWSHVGYARGPPRRAHSTPLQYLFARVPTRDVLMVSVLESVGYQEVGVIPPSSKSPARPEQLEFV
ncbi:MAG: hypothetical protein WBN38_18500, partial [Polyangiales bacterium]